ncbi:MAG: 3-hydroxylacyl-ACP dehydratase [Treponema sp.]|jgi:predicted hotdog family 3-hydroxylacyl-ACP dehydratase|nr:3-hydroxylacyl-ACP dehydratase [Treponema sp.]
MTDTLIIERAELLSIIPHGGKMALLDRITDYDLEKRILTAEYEIGPECLFYDPEQKNIPSWVSFEFMAQSVSALAGLYNRKAGRKPRPGFILSVSNLNITAPALEPGLIRIHIREDCRMDDILNYQGEVFRKDELLAAAKLTVMETDDFSLLEAR